MKAVSIAMVVGVTAAFAGFGVFATPAAAAETDAGTRICQASWTLADVDTPEKIQERISYFMMTNEVYIKEGCAGFIHDFDPKSGNVATRGDYSYYGRCNANDMEKREFINTACTHGGHVIIRMWHVNHVGLESCLHDVSNSDKLSPEICSFDQIVYSAP